MITLGGGVRRNLELGEGSPSRGSVKVEAR